MKSASYLVLCLFMLVSTAEAQDTTKPAEIPEILQQHFTPPQEFRGQLGSFRDVMKFDDGSMVKSKDDWQRRREEIRRYWHGVMGPWKPVNPKPKVEYAGEAEHVENFTRQKLMIEAAPDRFFECYKLVPDSNGKRPAVLVIWYNANESAGIPSKPGAPTPIWAFGHDLAKRGFVTLCMPDTGGIVNDKGVQPLSFVAYAASNVFNAMADMPEIDPKRIGVTGFSMGGKAAMFASCLDDRFACAVWIDGGIVWNEADPNANYWEPWYLGKVFDGQQRKRGVITPEAPRTGAYQTLVESGHDLHELHALMAPRPFMVSGGDQDPVAHWVPLNHAIKLYEFLGYPNRVGMTNRVGHTPTRESNEQVYAFFEHFLQGR